MLMAGKTVVTAQATILEDDSTMSQIGEEVFLGEVAVGTIISTLLRSLAIVVGRFTTQITAETPKLLVGLKKTDTSLPM